jgi:hypothetical protein
MKNETMIHIGSVMMLLLIGVYVLSCEKDSPTQPKPTFFEIQGSKGFVGKVDGTNAFISLLVGSHEGVVYVCNGDEEIAEWFREDITDQKNINLANSAGAQIAAQFKGESFEGNVTLSNDNTYSFSAVPITTESGGIYRVHGEEAERDEIKAGWILDSDGDERGSLRIGTTFQTNNTLIKTVLNSSTKTATFSGTSYPVWRYYLFNTADSQTIRFVSL